MLSTLTIINVQVQCMNDLRYIKCMYLKTSYRYFLDNATLIVSITFFFRKDKLFVFYYQYYFKVEKVRFSFRMYISTEFFVKYIVD